MARVVVCFQSRNGAKTAHRRGSAVVIAENLAKDFLFSLNSPGKGKLCLGFSPIRLLEGK